MKDAIKQARSRPTTILGLGIKVPAVPSLTLRGVSCSHRNSPICQRYPVCAYSPQRKPCASENHGTHLSLHVSRSLPKGGVNRETAYGVPEYGRPALHAA